MPDSRAQLESIWATLNNLDDALAAFIIHECGKEDTKTEREPWSGTWKVPRVPALAWAQECAGVRQGWFVVWAQGTQTELRIDCQTFSGNERSR